MIKQRVFHAGRRVPLKRRKSDRTITKQRIDDESGPFFGPSQLLYGPAQELGFYEYTMKSTILMKNHSYPELTLF
uniref:Uncharacterized protein n=1 Tax=Romanomermis culicivorax TaxID=13658 RepID=A0A915KRS7_ROMCU